MLMIRHSIATMKMKHRNMTGGPAHVDLITTLKTVERRYVPNGNSSEIVRRLSPKFDQHVLTSEAKYFPNLLKLNMLFFMMSIC